MVSGHVVVGSGAVISLLRLERVFLRGELGMSGYGEGSCE